MSLARNDYACCAAGVASETLINTPDTTETNLRTTDMSTQAECGNARGRHGLPCVAVAAASVFVLTGTLPLHPEEASPIGRGSIAQGRRSPARRETARSPSHHRPGELLRPC